MMPAAHLDALEADLVAAGWSWDDVPHRLPWRAVLAFVEHPAPNSAFRAATRPEEAAWADPAFLAFLISRVEFQVRQGNWMQSKDAQRRTNKPKPIPTPWDTRDANRHVIGAGAIPASEWDDFWGDGD